MVARAHTAVGTKFSISAGVPATQDSAGYSALTFTEVIEVTNIPDFGGTTNVVKYNPLRTAVTQKLKGVTDTGSGSVEFVALSTDAGQIMLKTASAQTAPAYAVKIEEQDGAISYFQAIFTSFLKKLGSADNIVMISANMDITTAIIDVAAP